MSSDNKNWVLEGAYNKIIEMGWIHKGMQIPLKITYGKTNDFFYFQARPDYQTTYLQ